MAKSKNIDMHDGPIFWDLIRFALPTVVRGIVSTLYNAADVAVLGIFGAQIACQMTFVSLGKALSSMCVAVMRKFVLLLPLIYAMPAIFPVGTDAIYAAEPVADLLAVSFTVALFSVQFKRVLAAAKAPESADFDN